MDSKDQEFLKRLEATFKIEANEHIHAIASNLVELEKSTADSTKRKEIIENIFRDVHSLKGAARSVNFGEIESICQPMESIFSDLKAEQISLSQPLFNLFHQALNVITDQISSPENTELSSIDQRKNSILHDDLLNAVKGIFPQIELSPEVSSQINLVQKKMKTTESSNELAPDAKTGEKNSAKADREGTEQSINLIKTNIKPIETVRIPINKLDPLLLQAEEMIQAKLSGEQHHQDLNKLTEEILNWKNDWEKWESSIHSLSGEETGWIQNRFNEVIAKLTSIAASFEKDQHFLRTMINNHMKDMKRILMLPISTVVEIFPKMVRDLAQDQDKEVDLVIVGADMEMDKSILEEIRDPLIHLIRNCIDHGIESPKDRIKHNKSRIGKITLSFSTKDGRLAEIIISDDGNGIDLEKVRKAAIKAGTITQDEAQNLDYQDTLYLIFESGLSTTEIITDLSGRGLGLAIVQEKVEKLGGSIKVETEEYKGTTFRLFIPLTRTTFRGIFVRVNEQFYVIPTSSVDHTLRVKRDEIQTVKNRKTIRSDGRVLTLIELSTILGMRTRKIDNEFSGKFNKNPINVSQPIQIYVPILVLKVAEKHIAIEVDEVLTEEEVLVKPLGKQLTRVRNIAGATVTGDGSVVLVLNPADLIRFSVMAKNTFNSKSNDDGLPKKVFNILVAEDSITSRVLLKNILENNGYKVSTAIDGSDALTQLRSHNFDLLVSDVDMPRMSGFELTAKIRNDKHLSELPVVLVTSLESRDDREHGIDVGANAYIIKSSFNQSNLLDVVQKLL